MININKNFKEESKNSVWFGVDEAVTHPVHEKVTAAASISTSSNTKLRIH